MPARSIRIGLVLLLACALLWALELAWWADQELSPSTRDIALYMLGLPLALFGGYWLLRSFIDGLRHPVAATPAPTSPPAVATTPPPAEPLAPSFAIAGGILRTAHGDDASQLLGALGEGKRPVPDAHLADADGFPVFAARIEESDTDAVTEQVDALAGTLGMEPIHRPAILRALAVLDLALPDICAALTVLAADADAGSVTPRICWFVPQDWHRQNFALLAAWLDSRLATLEDAPYAQTVLPAQSAADLLLQLGADAGQPSADAAPLLVLAASSFLTDDAIATWEGSGELFSGHTQHGRIPGEAAAALLLTPWQAEPTEQALPGLGKPAGEKRTQPTGSGGRPQAVALATTRTKALAQHGIEPTQICSIVTDIDHRAERSSEFFAALGDDFEHLDPATEVLATGVACGDTGIVAALLSLIVASELATKHASPVLCMFAQHNIDRTALVVLPATAPTPS